MAERPLTLLPSLILIISRYKILLRYPLDLKKLLSHEHDLVMKHLVSLLTIEGNEIVQKDP